jgi:RecA/RadA recombinase
MQPLDFRPKQCIHTTHTKVSPETTKTTNFTSQSSTQIIITNQVRIHKQVLQSSSVAEINDNLMTIQDIMMKLVHDIIHHYHHLPGTHLIPPTNQEE